jgi:hypothetical protein
MNALSAGHPEQALTQPARRQAKCFQIIQTDHSNRAAACNPSLSHLENDAAL